MAVAREREVPKRADARRNIAAIIEAATVCLARDPDVSVDEIAKEAGVGRVTLYGHFDSRAALVAEVVGRAMAQTDEALDAVDLTGDPREALRRLVEATWHLTHRYGALITAAERSMDAEEMATAHRRPAIRVRRLIERGRRQGSFRTDMSTAWLIAMVQSVIHGASNAVHRGEITAGQAPRLIGDTLVSAFTPPTRSR